MARTEVVFALCVAVVCVSAQSDVPLRTGSGIPCYDEIGRPQKCIPAFENAAFGLPVEASNTCGEYGPTEFCEQTGSHVQQKNKTCEICQPRQYDPYYLTDYSENKTWWQSETMFKGIQYPNEVNLTLKLHKAFDITYIRLLFWSPRPESFAIYKRTVENGPWIPYQYYSGSCRDTYGLPDQNFAYANDTKAQTRAFCTSEYSDISPLIGGNNVFSTLEGRPDNIHFETSPPLQEWVTATDILITLNRLNTFGDEVFGDPEVLKSYFYAIADIAVGARCKCNGHASECVATTAYDGTVRRTCQCQHNTAGPDCNECLPFYNDAPWARATSFGAHECKACNCNGFSNRCYFDTELFNRTGHGGHCLDCQGNRAGPNCERCRDNFYQPRNDSVCFPCHCNEIGSRSLQCNTEGKCQCKPGVTGDKCDRCDVNHYDFSNQGCKKCECSADGSYNNTPQCDPTTGVCLCKENVEGKRCRKCKPGYFNLDANNDYGCTPCFCYGHSSVCQSAPGYAKVEIESSFIRGNEKWSVEELNGPTSPAIYHNNLQAIEASAPGYLPVYFVAPDRFLRDQRASYNQDLEFKLRIGENAPKPTIEDIILEGGGLRVTQTIFGQANPLPSDSAYNYKFRLHEHPDHGWQPRLSSRDFISILANLTAVKIRGTYTARGVGFLDDVKLDTARRGAAGYPATWLEMCTCPDGYVGEFCESCGPGFRHEPASGGPFAPCVPCNCNGHADICDNESGRCICQHNTAGDNCERCARGYYGNALSGSPYGCKLCPCPNQGACIQLADETIVCLECPKGYGGPRCELCSDGYYGDPAGKAGPVRLCQPCDCSQNVDANAIGNCNRTTGECLKCIYNTGGPTCAECLPGFYGDALATPKGDCKPCQCYSLGTVETQDGPPVCDQLTGQCQCKPHVVGTNCDQCEAGFYNIGSGTGCQSCNCDPIGSFNQTCDPYSGQCLCRPGVTGLRCDVCQPYYYGFSLEGCKPCECDNIGSSNLQCDAFGQCPCYENVEGRRCDHCKENKYDRQRGCINCPPCYNLIQDAVNIHRSNLTYLGKVLSDIANTPTIIDDQDFKNKLRDVSQSIDTLWKETGSGTAGGDGDKTLSEKISDLHKRLADVKILMDQIGNWTLKAGVITSQAAQNVSVVEKTIEKAANILQEASNFLQTEGAAALSKAVERSTAFGQQSELMSKIAREARVLVQNQEDEFEKTKEIAEKAVNISMEAYETAKDAIGKQKNTSDELKKLGNDLSFTKEKLDLTISDTSDTKKLVDEVHTEALAIYRDIYALSIPDSNFEDLKAEAELAAKKAKALKDSAEELLLNNDGFLTDLGKQIKEAETTLGLGEEQQKITDELLADADAAKSLAEQAVKKGDDTLKEAQNTYNTLKTFDSEVKASKEQAKKTLLTTSEIEKIIIEARDKSETAAASLPSAEHNANSAKDNAKQAQDKFAKQAAIDADQIKRRAEETKQEAGKLREEADSLSDRVADTTSKINQLETKAKAHQNITDEAKIKVGQAKTKGSDALKQVEKAQEEVDYILKALSDLTDIDEETLNRLETRLAAAQAEFDNANVNEQLKTLTAAKITQTNLVKSYKDEVEKLKLDVHNIDEIQKSLPKDCWKRFKLEP
ncbi:laminin subunit gamma-1 isoform X1 [Bemisia tabaci]|uniref:laminin subunit gamma-1 isoform X1 n=1 Tax=Bemisia tabaci TaxID=7038 RepID=UPI003B28AC44